MTSMTLHQAVVTAGVDTHSSTHHAAVLDQVGRQLADRQFPATAQGCAQLLSWLREHGTVDRVCLLYTSPSPRD